MATLNYKLRFTKKNESTIYFRFNNGRDLDTVLSTPITIPNNEWDKRNQKLKAGSIPIATKESINAKLRNFKSFLLDKVRLAKMEGELINTPLIKGYTDDFFNRVDKSDNWKYIFEDYIKHYIENSEASYNTKKTFTSALQRLKAFQEYKKDVKYRIREVNLLFEKQFITWALDIKNYAPKTVTKTVKTFKQFLKSAGIEKLKVDPEYQLFKGTKRKRESVDIYLNETDIEQIKKYNAPDEMMENVKNLFLIGLYTGVRVSDLMCINSKNKTNPIIEDSKLKFVAIKTNQLCIVPIHNDIKDLFSVVKPISDVKFNLYIKRIAKSLEWDQRTLGSLFDKASKRKKPGTYARHELISSHIMRRSYATNRYKEGDDLLEICSATGHTTTKQLLNYLKITKDDHADNKLKRMNM